MTTTPLLPFPSGCVIGRFLRREKRFFVAAEVEGTLVWAHTNNTGSMRGLLREGAPVLLSPAQNPERKLRWTLELLWCGETVSGAPNTSLDASPEVFEASPPQGFWTGVNTSLPNRMLEAAFKAGRLPWASGYTRLVRERSRGESRLDGYLEGEGQPPLWVECKNVTLVEGSRALFPDAVSVRALKHVKSLEDVLEQGERAAMFYCVQRQDAQSFAPAAGIDPAYAEALYAAYARGVELYPHRAVLSVKGIDLEADTLPIVPCAEGLLR